MVSPSFESWYKSYPRKLKPRDAKKAWDQAIKRGVTAQQIVLSTQFMLATEWKGRRLEYIPYPASFLRSGDADAYEVDRAEALEDEHERTAGQHYCTLCKPVHGWQETGDPAWYAYEWKLACPQANQQMKQAIAQGLKERHVGK